MSKICQEEIRNLFNHGLKLVAEILSYSRFKSNMNYLRRKTNDIERKKRKSTMDAFDAS